MQLQQTSRNTDALRSGVRDEGELNQLLSLVGARPSDYAHFL